jgi:hypothetical protein
MRMLGHTVKVWRNRPFSFILSGPASRDIALQQDSPGLPLFQATTSLAGQPGSAR